MSISRIHFLLPALAALLMVSCSSSGSGSTVTPVLEAGAYHNCFVASAGTLWCWGDNRSGQLGDGTRIGHAAPAKVGTNADWRIVDAGRGHTCALKQNGNLFCWGDNGSGQVGDGSGLDRTSPAQIGSAAWTDVAAGGNHTCGVRNDGTLWCWGDNTNGQLGRDWAGLAFSNVPVQESSLGTTWFAVAAGTSHTCAVTTGGTLFCWGGNSRGQVGNDSTVDTFTPAQVGPVNLWGQVTAGDNHTCATRSIGTLFCWGANDRGQLGDGTTIDSLTPVQEGTGQPTGWSSVTAGTGGTCALRPDGTLHCWGDNQFGQQAKDPAADPYLATPTWAIPGITDWRRVTSGATHTCGLRMDGTLRCWGGNGVGQLGDGGGATPTVPTQIDAATDWAAVAAGIAHTCATKTDNTLWCWGANDLGQLGDGGAANSDAPISLDAATDWAAAGAGDNHTCAIKTDGTLHCWGENNFGQLGDSTTGNSNVPVQEFTTAIDWESVDGGAWHTCAVKTTGTLWCWGDNVYGQLGTGLASSNVPVQESTSANNWVTVATGTAHTCATKTGGTLWCWGDNAFGQTGQPPGGTITVPTQVPGTYLSTTIAAGGEHTCAIKTDGSLWCWGLNDHGQFGNGSSSSSGTSVPSRESTMATDWNQVMGGGIHTCAIKTDGTLWCWGFNQHGQLGLGGTPDDMLSPVQEATGSTLWASGAAGTGHTAAVRTDRTLWSWGDNAQGQLGNDLGWLESPVTITLP